MNNGFVIAASKKSKFYTSAILLAESILDYYPEAKITLFTEAKLFNENDRSLFDRVFLNAPHHERAKLWALPQTPYDKTCYVDADCECVHEDITNIFDLLDDCDIALTKIREYAGAQVHFNNGKDKLEWHCGVFLYDRTMIKFMEDWWYHYQRQKTDHVNYPDTPISIKDWDQYTFWYLLKKQEYKSIKIKEIDPRWNFVHIYNEDETKQEKVLVHHTI